MAGDWIKMRTNLRRHPKVVRMASALNADKLRIIGGLQAVWSVFDEHSEDGSLNGYTIEAMDEEIGFAGFSSAMVSVGWLEANGENLKIPHSEAHNGQSAKRRCQETERKFNARKMSASDADEMRTREEKRREEKEQLAETGFDRFWAVYPEKKAKKEAAKAWKSMRLDAKADELIADVRRRIATDSGWLEGFAPNPATYLRGERWNDAIKPPRGSRRDADLPKETL